MNTQTVDKCRFKACQAPIRWATSAASGKWIPLNAETVPAGTKGALVLIGEIAFSHVPAVARIADLFGIPESDADQKVKEEYGWHLAHFATCPFADKARRSR